MRTAIIHYGMTPRFFDLAVHRAHLADKVATPLSDGRWTVTSGSVPGLMYLTTRRECSCKGHLRFGRCDCRALVIYEEWCREQDRIEMPDTAA
jgi:hypothetical protein